MAPLRAKHPNVPWKSMARVRDRLVHHHFGANLDVVWEIVTKELPMVALRLAKMVVQEDGDS